MLTPEFRGSYVYLFEPQTSKNDDGTTKQEYTITAVFPKGTDLSAMKQAAEAVLVEKFGADKTKWPENIRSPFRKCKERWKNEGGKVIVPDGYEDGDATFVTMKSAAKNGRPGVVDASVSQIIEPHAVYSGAFFVASTNPFYYGGKPQHKGNKGVSFGLNNVQKTRDGEPLGGRSSPNADFKPIAGAEKASAGAGAKSVFDE